MEDSKKFLSDTYYGFASLFFLGLGGLLINFLIAFNFESSILGAFNQVYAIYILFSQIGTLGFQFSILKYSSELSSNISQHPELIISGLIIVFLTSGCVALLFYLLKDFIGQLLESREVVKGIVYSTLGLWAFSLNKYLLNILNGFQKIKAFSLFNSLRYLLLVISLIVLINLNVGGEALPLIFSLSEIILLIFLLMHMKKNFKLSSFNISLLWIYKHLNFGLKSLPGAVFSEINTRIDILLLGFFLDDSQVGLFSFAAFFIEGLMQIPQIFRRQIDPISVSFLKPSEIINFSPFLLNIKNKILSLVLIISFLIFMIFFIIQFFIGFSYESILTFKIFSILVFFTIGWGRYMAFAGLLAQGGYPEYQSLFVFISLSINILLNFILIPFFGIYGAALASGLSLLLSSLILRALIKKYLKIII